MKKAQKNCPFCHQKLKLSRHSFYSNSDNEMELASGGWTCLYIGLDPNGRTVMRACGDDYTNSQCRQDNGQLRADRCGAGEKFEHVLPFRTAKAALSFLTKRLTDDKI